MIEKLAFGLITSMFVMKCLSKLWLQSSTENMLQSAIEGIL